LPKSIENAPWIAFGLELYFVAFLDLTSCRQQGYAEGPIAWLTINDYADVHGYEGEQREDLFYHIQQLDIAYLNHKSKQIKKAADKGIGEGKKSGKRPE